MARSLIGQEPGAIKSVQQVTTGTTLSSGTTTKDYTITAVDTNKTEVYSTGWSQYDVSRQLTSSTNLQIRFRHGSQTHYWRAGFNIVEYY
jgi:hypothetical protein